MSKPTPTPPAWATKFLSWFCDDQLIEEIEGDLLEAFQHRAYQQGVAAAKRAYIKDVITFFKPYAFEKYSRAKQFVPMFDNQFKIALRNILKHKRFTLINALGLVIGICAVMLIGIYLRYEYTYDEQVPQYEQIYRLHKHYRDQVYSCMQFPDYFGSEREGQFALIQHLLQYEQVEQACHFVPSQSDIGGEGRFFAEIDSERYILENILFTNTGEAFHAMFPQQLIIGDNKTAFAGTNTIILTERLAARWFGEDWRARRIIGKATTIQEEIFTIQGVIANPPGNMHFDYELILMQEKIPSWGAYTYIKLSPEQNIDQLLATLNSEVDLVYPGFTEDPLSKEIQAVALTEIHFTPNLLYELKPIANSNYLTTFGLVGILILLIIWTNYTNLSVAMYADRQRELGMRKVLGARARDVAIQLMVEAVVLAVLCLPIIVGLLVLCLQPFSDLMEISFRAGQLYTWPVLASLGGLLLLTGLISGIYPALIYSQKATLKLFKSSNSNRLQWRWINFRNGLITLQFFLVVSLVSMTYYVYQQMQFIQNRDLGFEKENVVYFSVDGAEKYQALKPRLLAINEVTSVGAGGVPGTDMYNQMTYKLQGTETVFSNGTEQYMGYDAIQTLEIECDACQDIFTSGKESLFVINRTAAELLAQNAEIEVDELIGRQIITEPEWENEEYGFGIPHRIDGIIDDYKHFSLKYPNQPLLISLYRDIGWVYEATVRANTDDWPATLRDIKDAYASVEPDLPFTPNFLSQRIDQLYASEEQSGKLLAILSIVAILLALMGLAGVLAYLAYRKQKEIGIRKVLGASTGSILFHFQREFSLLWLLALVLAVPASVLFANRWLNSFAFHIEPGIWVVMGAGALVLTLVIAVITGQTYRLATQAPGEVIRKIG